MIQWFARGLRRRRPTTGYPRTPERPPPGFRARVRLAPGACDPGDGAPCAGVCVPAALTLDESEGALALDAGRCIGCGLCIDACPSGALSLDPGFELAVRDRGALIVPGQGRPSASAPPVLSRRFRRSIHIRHVDTGSDGAVEQELTALLGPFYDMHRLGLFFTASPRHADVLLATGPVTHAMEDRLRITYEAMPDPKAVVAAGTDACSGGIWLGPEVVGGVDRVLPVDVYVPGDPPSPIALLHALMLAAGRVDPAPPPLLHVDGDR